MAIERTSRSRSGDERARVKQARRRPEGDSLEPGSQSPGVDEPQEDRSPPYLPIGDYALIGDCHSAALVSCRGAIDWACLARFDDASTFGRLLDAERGGTFALTAAELTSHARRYLPDTNVLETTLTTPTGVARILDCFTMRTGGSKRPYRQLLRVAEGVRGEVTFDVRVEPRFDYGTLHPWLRELKKGVFTAVGGDDALLLSTDAGLAIAREESALGGRFTIAEGERRRFSLIAYWPHEDVPRAPTVRELDRRLDQTIAWWRGWVRKGHYGEVSRDAVVRSALVLKLLTCAPTGAIIAAPTTSLPEEVGGSRNWDYRYCWVRDATFTMSALLDTGHDDVARGLRLFLERATAGHAEDIQIMYGCYGERRLPEQELTHLAGYRGSRPVRVGNAAAKQTQLDVYGELVQASHLWRREGKRLDDDEWRFLRSLVDASCDRWREPDRGLWEVRGEPRHFVHSKVMCWVALQRGIEAAEEEKLPCDLQRWKRERDELRSAIEKEGVDPKRDCFVQSFGATELDASLLLLPMVGFVDAREARMRRTTAAIEEDLSRDGLILRYRSQSKDGVEGEEGTFLMASFWMVEVLAMQGALGKAKKLFQRLLGLSNEVGLYAEEYDPEKKEQLGNFPQAFTHMALVGAAMKLEHTMRGEKGGPAAERPQPRSL